MKEYTSVPFNTSLGCATTLIFLTFATGIFQLNDVSFCLTPVFLYFIKGRYREALNIWHDLLLDNPKDMLTLKFATGFIYLHMLVSLFPDYFEFLRFIILFLRKKRAVLLFVFDVMSCNVMLD